MLALNRIYFVSNDLILCYKLPFKTDAFISNSIPLCSLINQYLTQLAAKFPATKCLKSVSTTCIPNYPDKNLPTIFVYFEGELKSQIVGPVDFGGMNLTIEGEPSSILLL